MARTERIVLWTILGLLTLVNLGLLTEGTAPKALATNLADTLGPAAALTLEPAEADEPVLSIRNEEGHLAWGTHPQQRLWSVGCVHIGPILTQLMAAEPMEEERTELAEELQGIDEKFTTQLTAIQEEMQELDPEDEATQDVYQRGQALYQEYQQFQQLAGARQQQQQAEQLESAYRELISAVNVVADRIDLDIVMRFIPPDDEFTIANTDTSLKQIQLRTFVRYPEACNITSDVLEELNLEDK